eukprot:1456753-Prymnesium_polylepis.1
MLRGRDAWRGGFFVSACLTWLLHDAIRHLTVIHELRLVRAATAMSRCQQANVHALNLASAAVSRRVPHLCAPRGVPACAISAARLRSCRPSPSQTTPRPSPTRRPSISATPSTPASRRDPSTQRFRDALAAHARRTAVDGTPSHLRRRRLTSAAPSRLAGDVAQDEHAAHARAHRPGAPPPRQRPHRQHERHAHGFVGIEPQQADGASRSRGVLTSVSCAD